MHLTYRLLPATVALLAGAWAFGSDAPTTFERESFVNCSPPRWLSR